MKKPSVLDYEYSERLKYDEDIRNYIDYIEQQNKELIDFFKKLKEKQTNIEPEFQEIINKKFWEMI